MTLEICGGSRDERAELSTNNYLQDKIDLQNYFDNSMVTSQGICDRLNHVQSFIGYGYNANQITTIFPELVKYRPINRTDGDYWFSTRQERIEVLKKIINSMQKGIIIC